MDAHELIEKQIRAALATIEGVRGTYGEADLPLKDDPDDTRRDELPGYLVTIPGSENLQYLDNDGWGPETSVERTVQVDIGAIVSETRRAFLPEVRALKNAAIAKLADVDGLGIPGLESLRLLAIQRTTYPSLKGTAGGFYLAYQATFVSPLAAFGTISPRA